MKKIAVIGGGPAGMAAALAAARSSEAEVCLFEKNSRLGKKLLLSGSGQCNITHTGTAAEFLDCFPAEQRNFLRPSFNVFFRKELFALFSDCGLGFRAREDGKYFPESMRAGDVLDCLVKLLASAGVQVKYKTAVSSVRREGGSYTIEFAGGSVRKGLDAVIIASGGKSYPSTGSDGSGQRLAALLGHRIEELRPALADISVSDFCLSGCMGVSFANASAALYRNGRKVSGFSGDLLITHRGFSGPLILNNSRSMRSGDELHIDFCSLAGSFEMDFISYADTNGARMLKSFFSSCGFPDSIVTALLSQNGISASAKIAEVGKKQRKQLKQVFTDSSFSISSAGSFKRAMLTAGGVDLAEVNSRTLESSVCKGLYFAGEVLDIDGLTGGYNLQAAFSTGYLAGSSAAGHI